MRFSVPKPLGGLPGNEEKRVALSPSGVRELVRAGAEVVVESGAGAAAGFLDELYRTAGAQIVYSREEVFGRGEVVLNVSRPSPQDLNLAQPGTAVFAFWNLAVTLQTLKNPLAENRITAIGHEVIQNDLGELPVLRMASQITGLMAPQIAGRLLETGSGGVGILLPGGPGLPPADTVIVGGGTLGYFAARAFLGLGCSVYVLDISQSRLEVLDRRFESKVVTALATRENLEKYVSFGEVVVGAVLRPGEVAPLVITQEMVKKMQPGSVILDFSFDQGGCVETTRLQGPAGGTFVREGIIHFAVANCPSRVARSASHAQTHACLPYLIRIQEKGLKEAMRTSSALQRGCYTYEGRLVSPHVTDEPARLLDLIREG